jgi:hypothetical protein
MQVVCDLRIPVKIARYDAVIDIPVNKLRVPAVWVFVLCLVESHCVWCLMFRSHVHASGNPMARAAATRVHRRTTTRRRFLSGEDVLGAS